MHVDPQALDWRPHPQVSWDVLLGPRDLRRALEQDVRHGLGRRPRELPPKYFYDPHGSRLFDQITRLPEYYPTRREREILEARAMEIATRSGADTLVELGSGTSDKTRLLLRALSAAGTLRRFVPFDVDAAVVATVQDGDIVIGDFDCDYNAAGTAICTFGLGSNAVNLSLGTGTVYISAL